jgi:uncharacterized protein YlxW (UPF0749 family)
MKGTKWALGFVMLVFGLLLMTQFKVEQKRVQTDPTGLRADEIAQELKALKDQVISVEAERARLADENTKLKQGGALAGTPGVDPAAAKTLTPADILAGTREVQGPGLIVTLQETPESLANKIYVQDEDIRSVVNELTVSGAEAIAVNGQRLTIATGIRNVGQRIMVHRTMISSPIQIAVIGDANLMEAALRLRGGIMENLSRYGVKMQIQRNDSLRLPAFTSPPTYRFVRPAK